MSKLFLMTGSALLLKLLVLLILIHYGVILSKPKVESEAKG
jgi:hypothetical protein